MLGSLARSTASRICSVPSSSRILLPFPSAATSPYSAASRLLSSTTTVVEPPTRKKLVNASAKLYDPSSSSSDTATTTTTSYFDSSSSAATPRQKHKIPRKRCSKLLSELQREAVSQSFAAKPAVFGVKFSPGDALEVEFADSLLKGAPVNKVRGVVLGVANKGIATRVMLRDVVLGTVIERHLQLHSPMVKSVKVLKERFVKGGKKRIKRAKLYYLRDRPDNEVRVTG